MCKRYCGVVNVSFVRNEWLQLDPQLNKHRRHPGLLLCDWATAALSANLIVLNRGMHATPSADFEVELESTLGTLAAAPHGRAAIIYRSTHGVVDGCNNVPDPSPFLPLPIPSGRNVAFGWHYFREQNAIARRLVEAAGGSYIDVYQSAALRAGAPRPVTPDPNECVHFCLP